MTRKPRTLWVVMCRDVDGSEFMWDSYPASRAAQQALATSQNKKDAPMAKAYNRPRRRYWVEAYDRRAK